MVEIAVEAYMRPPNVAALDVVLTQDLASGEKADVMLRAKAQRDKQVAQELAAAEKALRRLRVDAEVQTARAEGAAEQAAQALDELHSAQLEQVGLAKRIKADLAATSQSLELAGRGGVRGHHCGPPRDRRAARPHRPRAPPSPLTQVRGIRVHADIAPAIEALLADAEADGIVLAGWGYRTTETADLPPPAALRRRGRQRCRRRLRSPGSACSPPTAKPGSSMHELGLAIDFTHDGASIGSHDSPAYQWLAAHAGDYGLRNLPERALALERQRRTERCLVAGLLELTAVGVGEERWRRGPPRRAGRASAASPHRAGRR